MSGNRLDIHGRYGILADINMVPLIDVSLTLVLVFIIMTPFLVRAQIKTNVPDAATGTDIPDEKRTLTVQIMREGQVFIESQPVSVDNLKEELGNRLPSPAGWSVVVEADRECKFEHVVQVMDTVKKAGVSKLGVAVRRDRRRGR